jgi:hypothetical protein
VHPSVSSLSLRYERLINQKKSSNFPSCVNNVLLLLSFIRLKVGPTSLKILREKRVFTIKKI